MDNIHWIYIQSVEIKDERDGKEQHDLVFQKCHYLHRQSFHHFPQISIILWIYMQSMEIRTREMEKREMVLFFKNGIICVDIISIISHKSPPFYGYTICSILYMQSVEIRTREMEKREIILAEMLVWGFSIRFQRHLWYLKKNLKII